MGINAHGRNNLSLIKKLKNFENIEKSSRYDIIIVEKNSKGDGIIYQENPQIVNLLETRFYEKVFKYLE